MTNPLNASPLDRPYDGSTASYPAFPTTAVEEMPAGEPLAVQRMIETLTEQLQSRYVERGTRVLRDAHPKITGLVRAQFVVDPDCPEELRYGVFGERDRYEALVRFSNGFPTVRHDMIPDVRGMAIKLVDVNGEFIDEECGQDFLLATAEGFFGRDAIEFAAFVPIAESTGKAIAFFLKKRLRGGLRLLQSMTTPASPLALNYFSQTPYRLGPHVVKYSARPAERRNGSRDPWYLRPVIRTLLSGLIRLCPKAEALVPKHFLFESLTRDLEREMVFEFLVQMWPDLSTLPTSAIEDATTVWPFPWTRVATLVLPSQTDLEDRLTQAERLTFQPWHARRASQPLGGINRARGAIYKIMSTFRNARSA